VISFSDAQWQTLLAGFLWPLTRILGLIAAAPLLGSASVPVRVRIGLALAVTLLLTPQIKVPDIEPWSAPGIIVLATQFIIGSMMGFAIQIAFAVVDLAGEVAGLQMGLGFASFFDPLSASDVPVIAQFLGMVATLLFLSLNGHLLLLSALAGSFELVPIAAPHLHAGIMLDLVESGGRIFVSGFMLALPVIGALLIINLALGVLTRAAPQLNLFSVGFPLTLLAGIAVLTLVMPYLGDALAGMFGQLLDFAAALFHEQSG